MSNDFRINSWSFCIEVTKWKNSPCQNNWSGLNRWGLLETVKVSTFYHNKLTEVVTVCVLTDYYRWEQREKRGNVYRVTDLLRLIIGLNLYLCLIIMYLLSLWSFFLKTILLHFLTVEGVRIPTTIYVRSKRQTFIHPILDSGRVPVTLCKCRRRDKQKNSFSVEDFTGNRY